ncbi:MULTISPECIES: ribonuclease P protein component [unclassified Mucilaginibacter]|uniref:ribonuclease P protein component n=1 Tax=unclassified Mucilaginibacter TaxID=2617802 RepID=UPI0031F6721F
MYTFKKEERLCNKRLLDELFRSGSSFLCYPFRVSWLQASVQQPATVQVVFAVSKKRYRRAVDRNLIKRRMREVYRLHKQLLLYQPLQEQGTQILLSLNYIGKEINDFTFMDKKMVKLLSQLCEQAYANHPKAV